MMFDPREGPADPGDGTGVALPLEASPGFRNWPIVPSCVGSHVGAWVLSADSWNMFLDGVYWDGSFWNFWKTPISACFCDRSVAASSRFHFSCCWASHA